MDTYLQSDTKLPRRRQPDKSSQLLLHALGVDLARLGRRDRAAMAALGEEVMALRCESEKLRQQLLNAESLADRDALCPLFNRRAFERELGREIALAGRFETPLSVVYIDLDRFKQVNDRFGHQTGDDVLLKVCEILVANTRETDIIGRLGGDEFGVVLTHAAMEDSVIKAEDLAARIGNLVVRDLEDSEVSPVTLGASCGVATWRRGMTAEDLIAEADEAMFAIKIARNTRPK